MTRWHERMLSQWCTYQDLEFLRCGNAVRACGKLQKQPLGKDCHDPNGHFIRQIEQPIRDCYQLSIVNTAAFLPSNIHPTTEVVNALSHIFWKGVKVVCAR